MEEILRMQTNLLLIRRAVGWTAEEFGDRIGVTRQTINNIESGRNKLTKTQYIAMRSVLDAEMVQHPEETQMLKALLTVLVDSPEQYRESEVNQLLSKANLMAPSILAGTTTRKEVSTEWVAAAGAIVGVAGVAMLTAPLGLVAGATAGVTGWLLKTVAKSDNKKGKGDKK